MVAVRCDAKATSRALLLWQKKLASKLREDRSSDLFRRPRLRRYRAGSKLLVKALPARKPRFRLRHTTEQRSRRRVRFKGLLCATRIQHLEAAAEIHHRRFRRARQKIAYARRLRSAAPKGNDYARTRQQLTQCLQLGLPKGGFSMLGKDLRN